MKKVIFSIFAGALLLAVTVSAEDSIRKTERERVEKAEKAKTVDNACVSSLISTREDSIMSAWKTLTSKLETSLTTRKTDLVSAWNLTDTKERRDTIKEIWKKNKTEKREASAEYKKAKKLAWSTFKTEVKKCGGSVASEAQGESEAGEKLEI